jgi:uncharacterized protein YjbI with pentapeptide repeats
MAGASLTKAKFEQATLQDVDLKGATLTGAILKSARLDSVDLSEAYLRYADLERASMRCVNFTGAVLKSVNLRYAEVQYSNLEEAASLAFANLEGLVLEFVHPSSKDVVIVEKLRRARTLEGVTLPDGTVLPGVDSVTADSDDAWRDKFDRWCSS